MDIYGNQAVLSDYPQYNPNSGYQPSNVYNSQYNQPPQYMDYNNQYQEQIQPAVNRIRLMVKELNPNLQATQQSYSDTHTRVNRVVYQNNFVYVAPWFNFNTSRHPSGSFHYQNNQKQDNRSDVGLFLVVSAVFVIFYDIIGILRNRSHLELVNSLALEVQEDLKNLNEESSNWNISEQKKTSIGYLSARATEIFNQTASDTRISNGFKMATIATGCVIALSWLIAAPHLMFLGTLALIGLITVRLIDYFSNVSIIKNCSNKLNFLANDLEVVLVN